MGGVGKDPRLGDGGIAESRFEVVDIGARLGEGGVLALDAATGVEDGGVVAAAQQLADLSQRPRAVVAEQVHRDVAGVGDIAGAGGAGYLLLRDVEVAADCLDDLLWCWL